MTLFTRLPGGDANGREVQLSIVTTLYRSAPYLAEFCERTAAAARTITEDYEVILVNDGSPDGSLAVALKLFRRNSKIRIIDLARNFGQHRAIMTGLARARGRLVFVLDSDLEEPPELLEPLRAKMLECSADVAYAVQPARKGALVERMMGTFFYRAFNWVAAESIPENVMCARLMTRRYVAALVAHREREVFLQGLWVAAGFRQVPLRAAKSNKGTSSYTAAARVAIAVNAITSFSNRPLVATFYVGVVISIVAIMFAMTLIIRRLFFGTLMTGWPSLIVSIWLIGGITIFSMGVLGIYLSKIFIEVKRRPYTIVRAVYSHRCQSASAGE
jgi:putative glycosyltransferase